MTVETNFGIVPATQGMPSVSPGTMPQFIQFRFNGVNLGGPDATVLDIVGVGLSLVRGTGVDAAKVTLTLS
jgi:hypothetical protein